MEDSHENGEISTRWKLGYAITCLIIFSVFAYFSQPERGAVAGFSFASIALVARIRWDLRNSAWFWAFLAISALFHVVALAAFNWKINVHPTILLAPLVIIDFAVLMIFLFLIEKIISRVSDK